MFAAIISSLAFSFLHMNFTQGRFPYTAKEGPLFHELVPGLPYGGHHENCHDQSQRLWLCWTAS